LNKRNQKSSRKLIVVGDRVLILPDEEKARTHFGLYLPQGIEEKEKIQGGFVVKVGPGYPLPDPGGDSDAPWTAGGHEASYLPLQVEEGDYVIFMRKSSIEVEYDNKKYLVIPQAAILLIIRDDLLDLDPDA
jgi:co-chaperonin GroES (HSP10)